LSDNNIAIQNEMKVQITDIPHEKIIRFIEEQVLKK